MSHSQPSRSPRDCRMTSYVAWLDDDRVGVFDLERARFDHFIATQREPDVSKVVLL